MKTILCFFLIASFMQYRTLTLQGKQPLMPDSDHGDLKINHSQPFYNETFSFEFESFSTNENHNDFRSQYSPGSIDTLNEYLQRTSSPRCYPFTGPDKRDLPLTGSNGLFMCLGQKFKITSNAKLKGLLVPFYQKKINGEPDTYRISVYNGKLELGEDVPDAEIGFQEFTLEGVDTSKSTPVYTYLSINDKIDLPEVFFIFLQTRNDSENEDGFVVWSNTQGDANHSNSSCLIRQDEITLLPVYYTFSEMPLDIEGESIDIDILILPVIDITSGIENDFSYAGMTFRGIYPNPASNKICFDISVSEPGPVELSILSAAGNPIGQLRNDYLSAGDNHFEYDISNLASGSYFMAVKSSASQFAVKFQAVK